MKNLLLFLLLLASQNVFSQRAIYTDDNGDGIIEYKLVNSSGQLVESGYYLNSKMVGTWTAYFPNGKKQMIAKYKNGLKHGTWLVYDNLGRVVTEVVYQNNQKIRATQNKFASN